MDPFNGFPNQQALVNMALTNQGMGTPHTPSRHMPQGLSANPLADVYGSSNALYSLPGQGNFGQAHLNAQMHTLQPQSIDGYVLQGNSTHNQGVPQQHSHTPSFPTTSFANLPGFGGALTGPLNDPYQRSAFGYGMWTLFHHIFRIRGLHQCSLKTYHSFNRLPTSMCRLHIWYLKIYPSTYILICCSHARLTMPLDIPDPSYHILNCILQTAFFSTICFHAFLWPTLFICPSTFVTVIPSFYYFKSVVCLMVFVTALLVCDSVVIPTKAV